MSYMPSVSTMPTHAPPQNWATRLLPAKVQKKREKNYEKRALKKIQEDQISNAPRCESLPSVKEKSESKIGRVESTKKNDTIVSESMVISETEPITESKVEEESNVDDITEAQTEQDECDDKNGTLDISAKKGDTVKYTGIRMPTPLEARLIEEKKKLESQLNETKKMVQTQHSINISKITNPPPLPKKSSSLGERPEAGHICEPGRTIKEVRPMQRATEDDLENLEKQVREKIGRIYEKIDGFVAAGVVDPKSIIRAFPQYEQLNFDFNRRKNSQTSTVMSRNITPEADEFNFQMTPEGSLTQIPNRTVSYYSVKDTIPETIPEEDEEQKQKRQSLEKIRKRFIEPVMIPSLHDQTKMIEEAEALHLTILDQQKPTSNQSESKTETESKALTSKRDSKTKLSDDENDSDTISTSSLVTTYETDSETNLESIPKHGTKVDENINL